MIHLPTNFFPILQISTLAFHLCRTTFFLFSFEFSNSIWWNPLFWRYHICYSCVLSFACWTKVIVSTEINKYLMMLHTFVLQKKTRIQPQIRMVAITNYLSFFFVWFSCRILLMNKIFKFRFLLQNNRMNVKNKTKGKHSSLGNHLAFNRNTFLIYCYAENGIRFSIGKWLMITHK